MKRSALHKYSLFVMLSTFFLIIAGALVTSTGSGLAVPDWPLSFGKFFPAMEGGVFFEHGHRMIAGTVGLLTLVLCISLWKFEPRRWLCWLGTAALGAVLIQALLGGITVLYGLPLPISTAHAILAQSFFCLTVSIAYFTSPEFHNPSGSVPRKTFRLAAAATCFIFIQLVLGSVLRHGGGKFFLNSHLVWALMVAGSIVTVFLSVSKEAPSDKGLVVPALLLVTGLITQVALGILVFLPMIGVLDFLVWHRTPLVTAHVATGAFLLGCSFLLSILTYRAAAHDSERSANFSILRPQGARS